MFVPIAFFANEFPVMGTDGRVYQFDESMPEGVELAAPPLDLIDCEKLGRQIVSAAQPFSNDGRVLTAKDWGRITAAIRHVLDTAGQD